MAGLACRQNDRWAMRVMAPLENSMGEVRTASSDTPEAVLNAVDAVIAGETLDAAGETAARDSGWR